MARHSAVTTNPLRAGSLPRGLLARRHRLHGFRRAGTARSHNLSDTDLERPPLVWRPGIPFNESAGRVQAVSMKAVQVTRGAPTFPERRRDGTSPKQPPANGQGTPGTGH